MRASIVFLSFVSAVAAGDGREPTQLLQESCATTAVTGADPDLYCIELLPAAGVDDAAGIARLVPPSSPFGIAVGKAGEPQHDVEFALRQLPAPSSLGKYTVLVAWAVPPQLR